MGQQPLRQFEDIHTHIIGNPHSICSLPIEKALQLHQSDINQPFSLQLHPQDITEWNSETLERWNNAIATCANDERFVAIGECGLDALCETPMPVQIEAFRAALLSAKELHKPTIIHMVRCWSQMEQIVNEVWGKDVALAASDAGCPLIIHGYRKGLVLAQDLVRHGFYLSLGEKYNSDVAKLISSSNLYHETDHIE